MINLFISIYSFISLVFHPYYLSVTEIDHNAKNNSIEVSCHIFTDDLEKALRLRNKNAIDLTQPADKASAEQLVNDYIQEKLKITIDGKAVPLKYLGYEIIEDAVWTYYEGESIPAIKTIKVYDAILYEHIKEQSNLVHITVNGNRKSVKLLNPACDAEFAF